jgi:hypothetical protein
MNDALNLFIDRFTYNLANYIGEYLFFTIFLIVYTCFDLYLTYRFKKQMIKRIEANENKIDRLLDILEEKGCEDLNTLVKIFVKKDENDGLKESFNKFFKKDKKEVK